MDKFFKFIDRVNALAFFAGVVLALGLLIWGIGNAVWESKSKTSVIVPNAAAEKSEVLSLTAWEFIPETGVQVLKLQSKGGESSDYASEGSGYKTRNLLFVNSDGGASTWLFPDQTHLISRVERLTTPDGRTKAIYFESRPAGEKIGPQFALFLANPDGTSPKEVLKRVENVLIKRVVNDKLMIIYQDELNIKVIFYGLLEGKHQGNKLLAKIKEI